MLILSLFFLKFYTDEPTKPTSTPSDIPKEVSDNDGRSGLMAAIRNAGGKKGAKLKSGKERKKERKQEKAAGASGGGGGGGDIMSDLFAKISMRRKGISGSSKPDGGRDEKSSRDNNTDSMSPMDKISAMIPPPSHSKDRSDTHDSEDWEDED